MLRFASVSTMLAVFWFILFYFVLFYSILLSPGCLSLFYPLLSIPFPFCPLFPCLRFVFPCSILSSRSPSFYFLLFAVLSCCLVFFCPALRCDFSPAPHCPVWSSEQHCLYFEMFKPLKCLNRRLVESERDAGRNRRINWEVPPPDHPFAPQILKWLLPVCYKVNNRET